jgi:hypothetical protein
MPPTIAATQTIGAAVAGSLKLTIPSTGTVAENAVQLARRQLRRERRGIHDHRSYRGQQRDGHPRVRACRGGRRTPCSGSGAGGGTGPGPVAACQWSVRDRLLFMRSAGSGWQEIARYAVHEDGSVMMWTFADDSKRIWERQ